MQKIDGPYVVPVRPALKPPANPPGWFDGGDPAQGRKATRVTADWLNTMQAEILAVIEAAGLVPDRADSTQLLQALLALAGPSGTWITGGGGAGGKTGGLIIWPNETPPEGTLECNGAAISRTAYADLFAVLGQRYGPGDGSTTFNLPDLRGVFLRGWDHGRGLDPNRILGGYQSDAIRNITGSFYASVEWGWADGAFTIQDYGNRNGELWQSGKLYSFNASRVVPTAAENRPVNVAMMFCIKY